MYILEKLKLDIAEAINKKLGRDLVKPSHLVYPPDEKMGDLSLPCFDLTKILRKNPAEIAKSLAEIKISGIKGMKAVGPYLNIFLDEKSLAKAIVTEIGKEKDKFGQKKRGKKRVMIEYSQPNTHKEFHIGHLRNLSYGDSIVKILAANGNKSIPVSYINDFGIHVAKTIWWTYHKKNKRAEKMIKDKKIDKGYFLGQMYAGATRRLEEFPEEKQEVGEVMKQIESRKGKYYELWEKTRKWSLDYFNLIYKNLDIQFAHTFYENDFVDKGKKMVEELTKKKVLVKSDGAVIADLNEFSLGVLVFLRADGTALYPVADLPLAIEKFKKFRLNSSIYVVDIRQGLYFKQLFKVLEILGYKQEMVHLGYDFVRLPSGMMSSRTGNVVTFTELYQELKTRVGKETKNRHPEWSTKRIGEVVLKLVAATIKFEMLKVGARQVITFDMETALRFDGFTAAYLEYTYARINSISKKAKKQENKKANFELLSENKEHGLILALAKFGEAVERAGENYDPSEIAKYLFNLAQTFNDYYHSVPVLKAEEKTRNARLALIAAVNRVLKNGLGLLGIETVREM